MFRKSKGAPDVKHLAAYKDMDDATRMHQRIKEIRPVLDWMHEHPDDGGPSSFLELAPPRFIHDLIRELDRHS